MNYNQGKNHPKFVDLTGRQFGELKILDYVLVQEGKQTVWKWKCVCSCGEYTNTRTKDFLKQKPVQSCARCGRKRMGKTNTLTDNLSLKNRLFRRYKRGASNRGYSFKLDFGQVMEITSQNCHYCNQEPQEFESDSSQNKTSVPFLRNGIDRKDNTLGYEEDNVLPCCRICNRMKMDLPYSQFIEFISKCYHHLMSK
jgi:hypothetical protein